jgi:outer membrane immunogenic protein
MRRLSVALIAAASTIALSQIAWAADMARPVYKAPPPAPIVQDWSGIYVGIEGGYGWGDQNATPSFPNTANATQCEGNYNNINLIILKFGIVGTNVPGEDCSGFIPHDHEFQKYNSLLANDVPLGKIKQNGWLAGGFFGAQKQWGSLVLGIEGDIDAANINGSTQGSSSAFHGWDGCTGSFSILTVNISSGPCDPISKSNDVAMQSKIDMLASLRGKVGWAFAPDWLLYGTGGAAFGHVKNTINQSSSVSFCDEQYVTLSGTVSGAYCFNGDDGFARVLSGSSSFIGTAGTTMFGWSAGAGLDWKFWHDGGSAWVLGVEYLHYGFPNQTITLADNNGASYSFTAKENVDVVKARISYLFSIH